MAKTVTVQARFPGQKPDRSWAAEGDVFDVPEDKVSARWMVPVKAEKSKAKADK